MYAVIETGGQQFRVQEGDLVKIEKIEGGIGEQVELDKVLLIRSEQDVKVGRPYVEGDKVIGEIIDQNRDKKVVVFKFKRRRAYQKKRGHRQHFTAVKIARIIG